MHCFHSALSAEAFTREACMVEAIGKSKMHTAYTRYIHLFNTQVCQTSLTLEGDSAVVFVNGQYRRKDSLVFTFYIRHTTFIE